MRILKIEFKNFNSYGNKLQILDFSQYKEGSLNLLLGKNAAGKSSVISSITYGLFGQVPGKKLSDLPNRINKSLYVKIHIEKGSKYYVVERGIAPNIFTITDSKGNEVDIAGKKNLQDFLEKEVIDVPLHMFNNIISISLKDFKSFINISPSDKRQIIDKLFGLSFINTMNEIVKTYTKEYIQLIDRLNYDIASTSELIESTLVESAKINEKLELRKIANQESYKKDLIELYEIQEKLKHSYKKLKSLDNSNKGYKDQLLEDKYKIKYEYDSVFESLNLYNNDQCPTCGTALNTSVHLELKKELEIKSNSLLEKFNFINDQLLDKSQEEKINYKKEKVASNLEIINTQIEVLKSKLELANDSINDDKELDGMKGLVSELTKKEENSEEEKNKYMKRVEFSKFMEKILGEQGVKLKIIDSIIPSLNIQINKYLKDLGLTYDFQFDSSFNVKLKQYGRDVSTDTLSEGEGKRLDFAILIAFIEFLKIKFADVNFIFFDELLSSVDGEGIHQILILLKRLSSKLKLNIFVINHAEMPKELFNNIYKAKKINNFSNLLLETEL